MHFLVGAGALFALIAFAFGEDAARTAAQVVLIVGALAVVTFLYVAVFVVP